ncbi:5-formyltetrahydrofolate cyclo-ligase [Ruminiclostridium papyrosolvens]|uniref:5-formyltetrahydrofolate cyclo-ligase n=1 Tax=Ruminiclostridium papyrosolvens C7 TaxID=1330534 RepID=U4R628_9FIRM|nr:5-formyltetrahydrofolate cyclo-ligase [Ruminiclostridium papyrosolvens]EPR14082.1 5-formyltetrahydrofolate cyclo-ligase [Ruminiclostridium papyrosolvens C7]
MYNKNEMRKKYISFRNNISSDSLHEKSKIIGQKLYQLDCVKRAETLMCYVSFGSEVYTHDIIKTWLSQGKQICVPRVVKAKGKSMEAVKISSLEELEPGTYGVLEPTSGHKNTVSPDLINVIIVPGCAFDLHRNRMGYGAGYYDRFLDLISDNCLKVGVAFDFQIMGEIPCDEHDIPMDIIITEERNI